MAVTEACEHTDIYIECPQCDDVPKRGPKPGSTEGLVARYHGACPVCGDDVFGYELEIRYVGKRVEWVHKSCV